jgi:hypothetical protein
MVFQYQHHALCAVREQYEELFAAQACGSTPAQSLHLLMNQRNVLLLSS